MFRFRKGNFVWTCSVTEIKLAVQEKEEDEKKGSVCEGVSYFSIGVCRGWLGVGGKLAGDEIK